MRSTSERRCPRTHGRARELEVERHRRADRDSAVVARTAQPDDERSTTSVSNASRPDSSVLTVTLASRSTRRRGASRRSGLLRRVAPDDAHERAARGEHLRLAADESIALADEQRDRVAFAEAPVDDRPTSQPDQAIADVGDLRRARYHPSPTRPRPPSRLRAPARHPTRSLAKTAEPLPPSRRTSASAHAARSARAPW